MPLTLLAAARRDGDCECGCAPSGLAVTSPAARGARPTSAAPAAPAALAEPATPALLPSPPPTESGLERLLKMTPTEVLAIYPAVLALAAVIAWPYYEATMAALGLITVVATLRRDGRRHRLRPSWQQHLVRCLAFAAWTLVLGNPLALAGVSAEQARLFGAAGAAFIPLFGYLALPDEPEAPAASDPVTAGRRGRARRGRDR